jgi:hypothetical protein
MINIPQEIAESNQNSTEIPQIVAKNPREAEAPELNPYVISFVKYNESLCEISELNSNKARKALEIFKTVGIKIYSRADLQRNYIDQIPVRREGDYMKLYNGLDDDIDLKEIKLQQDARIFYFDIETERTFYIIAITQNHFETDKVRR